MTPIYPNITNPNQNSNPTVIRQSRCRSESKLINTEIFNKYEIENSKAKVIMGRKLLLIEEKIERLREQIQRLEKDKKNVVRDYEKKKEANYSKMIGNAFMS